MSQYDYTTRMIALEAAVDAKIAELNEACYSLRADHNQTTIARSQRIQLMAVKAFIEMKVTTL